MNQPHKLLILAAALSLTLAACGGKKPAATKETEIAMKVNGVAITVAELNDKAGRVDSAKKSPISGPMLKMVANTELLHQAALQAKLDADPEVHARIANATRSIMATAYLEKQLAGVGKPTAADIGAYFNQHPERYGQRMQYDLQEMILQPPAGKEAEIQAQVASAKKVADLDQWLTKNGIPHRANPVSKTSDQIPEEILQKLSKVPVGGAIVLGGQDQMNVIFVLGKQLQPLTLAEASRAIAFSIENKSKSDIVDTAVKKLRDKAKFEYVAPYTETGLAASAGE